MTQDKARELIAVEAGLNSGYNHNAAKLILAEVLREHGQQAIDNQINEFNLEATFGFVPGKAL